MPTSKFKFNLQEFGGSVIIPVKNGNPDSLGLGCVIQTFTTIVWSRTDTIFCGGPGVCGRLKLLERLERLELI